MSTYKKTQHTLEHDFEMACRGGDIPELELILKQGLETFSESCLERAVRYSALAGQHEVLQLLTEEPHCLDIAKLDEKSSNSSLMAAVAGGSIECIKILAPISYRPFRTKAMVIAISKGQHHLVEHLYPHIDSDTFFKDLFSEHCDEKTGIRMLPIWGRKPEFFYEGLDIIGVICSPQHRALIIEKIRQRLSLSSLPQTMSLFEEENLQEKIPFSDIKESKIRL